MRTHARRFRRPRRAARGRRKAPDGRVGRAEIVPLRDLRNRAAARRAALALGIAGLAPAGQVSLGHVAGRADAGAGCRRGHREGPRRPRGPAPAIKTRRNKVKRFRDFHEAATRAAAPRARIGRRRSRDLRAPRPRASRAPRRRSVRPLGVMRRPRPMRRKLETGRGLEEARHALAPQRDGGKGQQFSACDNSAQGLDAGAGVEAFASLPGAAQARNGERPEARRGAARASRMFSP